jgi:hypothetical protein
LGRNKSILTPISAYNLPQLSLVLQRKWMINILPNKLTPQETPKRRKIRPNKGTKSLSIYDRENPLIAYDLQ